MFVMAACRGKIMSQRAKKLQRPFLANSIYCSDPISKMLENSSETQINSCGHQNPGHNDVLKFPFSFNPV